MHPDAVQLTEQDIETGTWHVFCECPEPCCVFRCAECGRQWKDHPCQPECCGPYVEWVNYVQWRKAHRHDCGVPRCPLG